MIALLGYDADTLLLITAVQVVGMAAAFASPVPLKASTCSPT